MKKELLPAKLLILCMILVLTVGLFLILSLLTGCSNKSNNKNATPTDATSSDATKTDVDEYGNTTTDTSYTPENSDFIYTDDSMTEIIGITDKGINSLDLIFPSDVTKISNISLSNSTTIKNIYFLNTNVVLDNVNLSCVSLETIDNLPSTLKSIPDNMFYGCSRLKTIGDVENKITLPENVTSIGVAAFSGCSSINNIDLSNIEYIKQRTFENCSSLNSVIWNTSLNTIEDSSFIGCGFEKIELPESVNTIGAHAFTNNQKLKEVVISDKTVVDKTTFNDCPKLTGKFAN